MTVLLWRVRPRSLRRVGAARALDEHLLRGARRTALRALQRAALDDLDQPLHALALDRVRDLVGQLRRLGPAPRREDEREGRVVADLLDDLERGAEVLLGLAREADDDVGRDRAVGDVLADHRDALHVALAVVGAAHRLQDPARARLQRQVDVLAQARQLGVRDDHLLAHVLRVRARVAHALDALDAVHERQQVGEVDPLAPAAGRARTSSRSGPAGSPRRTPSAASASTSAHDVGGRAALLAPARGRHDAVRAHAVAADRDLDPRLERALALGRQVRREALELEVALRLEVVGGAGTRPACRSGRARTRRPRTGTARTPGPSATATSSRPRRRSGSGPRDFSRFASPRLPISRLSADSRIEQVLKRIRSAPSRSPASS